MELTRNPLVKGVLKSRWPQWAFFTVLLAMFLFAIFAGIGGTPVGNHNFGIVFVWIAWWAILILVAVPLFGRGWCAVCPIPVPGEWLQRGAVLDPPPTNEQASKGRWLNLRWPNKLRNIWLQNTSFLLVALFSSIILTTPQVTALVLASMLFLAIGMSLVFERRSFCRYLCPVGGFIGLYAQTAPLELRTKDKSVCVSCEGKPCYNGSQAGYGCPWQVFPGGLTKNTYCGLCMECLRTCPHDNIAVNIRPFAADLSKPSARLDEAYKAFIMLGSAMIYAAVLLGPWGSLKSAAYQVGSAAWFVYAAVFLVVILLALPGAFWLVVRFSAYLSLLRQKSQSVIRRNTSPRSDFSRLATALIPLGLAFWVAFSLSFVLTNGRYILMTLSDPLGWGWNLFGTAQTAWQPVLTFVLAPLQSLVLVGGFAWSARTAQKNAAEIALSPAPIIVFCLAVTLLMLWLLL